MCNEKNIIFLIIIIPLFLFVIGFMLQKEKISVYKFTGDVSPVDEELLALSKYIWFRRTVDHISNSF